MGKKEFASVTGMSQNRVDEVLGSENEYVLVNVVSVACQINKTHGDPDPNHSSISECLKGTTVRLPQPPQTKTRQDDTQQRPQTRLTQTRSAIGPMYDQKSVKLLNFGINTITLLVLCYFLGGIVLAPLVNLQPCVGLSFSPPMASPCLGSVLGLIIGAFGSLGYTYYYFTRKL